MHKYSLKDVLQNGKVRIPKIQRDYAQGRLGKRVEEIRKAFVNDLLLVVKGKRSASELDFVYGSNYNNAFEPLDGQQRLTTLFLLHWMMGETLCDPYDTSRSIFTYETRNTSSEFCDELVQHNSIQFVMEALDNKDKNKTIKEEDDKKPETPSKIMEGRDWFKWEWRYDPTVSSMLVMIDAIFIGMGEDREVWDEEKLLGYCQNLKNITFNLLNLGDFGMSNELFIKMNARGKQLSDFDKLKSTLEEEIQIQQQEKDPQGIAIATEKEEELWRSFMDGAWIDLFWHKYARQEILENTNEVESEEKSKTCLDAAKNSEDQFKKLLLRLIALQLFECQSTPEKLREAAYNIDEESIDGLLFAYNESLSDLRSDENHIVDSGSSVTICFNQLIDDVNLLIFKDADGLFRETSSLLPQFSHISNEEKTLFDCFLERKVPNDVELVFFAMLLFLRSFPPKKERFDEKDSNEWLFKREDHIEWMRNYEDWVCSARNILLNDNNNQRIDKIQISFEASQSIKQFAQDFCFYVSQNSMDLEEDGNIVKKFLTSSEKTYQRLDNQSLAEERLKAKLILEDEEWSKSLSAAERHPYLWGQVRCLLAWSENNRDVFCEYSTRLLQLLDFIGKNDLTYYSAILAFMPKCWEESNRLFQYNKDRDNSFKRFLREHTREGDVYGAYFKALIDTWINEYEDKNVSDFLNLLIQSKTAGVDAWIQCIIKDSSILNESWNKRLFSQAGHVIMAQRKREDSHCFDPIFVYFRNLCKIQQLSESTYKLYDSKSEYEHAFELKKNNHSYFAKWDDSVEGNYLLEEDDNSETCTPAYLIDYLETVINC